MNSKNKANVCPLISKGYFSQAKDKINFNEIDINEKDVEGRTILILCSFIEEIPWSLSLARFVIQLGANISSKDFTNQMNVLHYCCIFEQEELLEILLESVDFDINSGDSFGNTPLLYAIATNNSRTIDSLLKFYQKYKINVDKANIKGVNPLMQASLNGNLELIKKLTEIGANEYAKDVEGKSAARYKEEAIVKFDLTNELNEIRRLSRMVRFDDIELILKLQREQINLKEDSNKMPEIIDQTLERIKLVKNKVKKIKRNKIDNYMSKLLQNNIEHNKNIEIKNDLFVKNLRPRTAMQTSQALKDKANWYSIVGPVFVSLEQQSSTSFRSPHKHVDNYNHSHEFFVEKFRNHHRNSRSIISLSRKNSITGRLLSNNDGSDSVFTSPKIKKKVESMISTKNILKGFSKSGLRSSVNSLNNS